MADVLAVLEEREGNLRGASLEVVSTGAGLAESLGGGCDALVIGGPGAGAHAARAGTMGAARILVGEHPDLADDRPEVVARLVAERIREGGYGTVLFSATARGKDLAPRVAALLGVAMAGDVTAVDVREGQVHAVRPVYAGKAFARVTFRHSPALMTLRPNVFPAIERGGAGETQAFTPELPANAPPGAEMIEFVPAGEGRLDVAEASMVVSGGRGLKDPDQWSILEELRDALGPLAALGASRAVVDAGWRPHAEQVGQTGKTVAPRLYFAIGISGAIQHLAGMRTAGVIVAVNRDPDAPIFQVADYGIVGDLFEVVPRLSEEIRSLKAAD